MTAVSRRQLMAGGVTLAGAGVLGARTTAVAAPRPAAGHRHHRRAATLHRWARDTWRSMVAMTDERTGLTADNISGPLASPVRSGYTSPTNIGGYLWSAVVARELRIISRSECRTRLAQTLDTLAHLEHHRPSGMFYNWYDEATGAVLTRWPSDGGVVQPFLSSVDNGWLAAGLTVARSSEPSLARDAERLLRRLDFGNYYDPEPTDHGDTVAGLLRGGFWADKPAAGGVEGQLPGGHTVWFTPNYYDTTVSETRITSYLAIARGQVPAAHYFAPWRVLPLDRTWQEQRPVGVTRSYGGLEVFEGAYTYRGMRIVPGWGGSMFESLMPDVFVPEERWAPRSWGVNHRLTVRAHREHGLEEAGYGFWGFSPASDPAGGYREYGVDAIGMNPDGYYSDQDKTTVDLGFAPDRAAISPQPTFGDGVVTPHASFLAMQHEPRQAYANLVKIERELGAYGEGGFYDAVAVRSGTVARTYLSLDQAMVLGALGNMVGHEVLRRAFTRGAVARRIRPLIAQERFSAGTLD